MKSKAYLCTFMFIKLSSLDHIYSQMFDEIKILGTEKLVKLKICKK